MAALGLHCCAGFSLVAVSRGYSLAVVRELLTAVATSLVAEQGLYGAWASVGAPPGLWSAGLIVVAYRLSYSLACGLLDQGSNPCLLHWQADSLPLSHRGCPSAQSLYLPSVHMLCSALTPTTVLCGTLLLLFFLLKLLHRQRSYILCRANSLAILFGLNFLHGTMWEAV